MGRQADLHAWRAAAVGVKWVRRSIMLRLVIALLAALTSWNHVATRPMFIGVAGTAIVAGMVGAVAAAWIAWRGPVARGFAMVAAIGCLVVTVVQGLRFSGIVDSSVVVAMLGWLADVGGMLVFMRVVVRASGGDDSLAKLVQRSLRMVIVGLSLFAVSLMTASELVHAIGGFAGIAFCWGFVAYIIALGRVRRVMVEYAPEPPRATVIG